MTVNCPHCGGSMSVSLRKAKSKLKTFNAPSWVGTSAETLEAVPQPPRPQQSQLAAPGYRETPFRAPNMESDVWVPLAQAGIFGVCVCVLSTIGWLELEWAKPGLVFVSSLVLGTGCWWIKDRKEFKKTIYAWEERLGVDLTGDNQIGEPQIPDRPVVVEVWSNGGYKKRHSGLSERQVEKVALAVFQNGAKFSRRELCEGYRCFPADKYQNLVEIWVGLGLLERKGTHDNAPVSLTEEGLDFLGRYYDPPAPSDIG